MSAYDLYQVEIATGVSKAAVLVDDLVEAVFAAKKAHDLCDMGVADFFALWDIDATRRITVEVSMTGKLHLEVPFHYDYDCDFDNGDADIAAREGLVEMIEANDGFVVHNTERIAFRFAEVTDG